MVKCKYSKEEIMYSPEEFDEAKTKVLKYIIYKRRTENEVKIKFQNCIEENMLQDIIEYLKQTNYINDEEYIQKATNNFKILKNLSLTELKYKLLGKGLDISLIENYFYTNKEELIEYEIKSAMNIIIKKKKDMDELQIKNFLLKKGYKNDNINIAFERSNN